MSIFHDILHALGLESEPKEPVNIALVLDDMAAHHDQKLDWRHSVVDLMKTLDMDSSLDAREELANELHFPGVAETDMAMNVWLHTEILRRVAANGGKVPEELL